MKNTSSTQSEEKKTTLPDGPMNQKRKVTYQVLAGIQKPFIELIDPLDIMPFVLSKLVVDYLCYWITSDETQADLETKMSLTTEIKEEFWQQFEGVRIFGFEQIEIKIQNINNYRRLEEWIIQNPSITYFIFNNGYLLSLNKLKNKMEGLDSMFLSSVFKKSSRDIDLILIDLDFSKDLDAGSAPLNQFFTFLQKQKSIKQISYKITNIQGTSLHVSRWSEQAFLTIFRKKYPNPSEFTKKELKLNFSHEKNYEFWTQTNKKILGSFHYEPTRCSDSSIIFNIY